MEELGLTQTLQCGLRVSPVGFNRQCHEACALFDASPLREGAVCSWHPGGLLCSLVLGTHCSRKGKPNPGGGQLPCSPFSLFLHLSFVSVTEACRLLDLEQNCACPDILSPLLVYLDLTFIIWCTMSIVKSTKCLLCGD